MKIKWILPVLTSLFIIAIFSTTGTIDSSKPTKFVDTGISINETKSYDEITTTFSLTNTSTGNLTYHTFSVGAHSNSEDIKSVQAVFDIEISGTTDDEWALKYSDDAGVSWSNLRSLQTGNLPRQTLEYSLTESTDDDWTWNEIANDLRLRLETKNVGSTDSVDIKLYETYLNVTYDNQGPKITIFEPINNANFTTATILFSYNVTDTLSGITNCSLFINDFVNITNSTIIESNNNQIFEQTFPDGTYSWSISCYDNSTVKNQNNSEQKTFFVDLKSPKIRLNAPGLGDTYNSSNIVILTYNVSDTSMISNCSILINGSVNKTNFSIQRYVQQSFKINLSNGEYFWAVNCTDATGKTNQTSDRPLTVDVNQNPTVDSILVPEITLFAGSKINVLCNTTVSDSDGSSEISSVVATLYHSTSSVESFDENSSHYTNASCTETDSQELSKDFSCGFDVWYYAKEGSWYCYVNVTDSSGGSAVAQELTTVGHLYAINVLPQVIDFGSLYAGNISQSDVEILVSNFGNKEIDITLDGYARFDGDGLAMNCTVGNISLSYERYSLTSGLAHIVMNPLTDSPVQLDEFNLKPKNDSASAEKSVYWKIEVPKPKKGSCSGYVTFSAVAT
ncbi:MAG: hypothetical protein KKB65_05965 [Nanoarchaeota archaeon]|nr:hypothetical protein [Nanoarchaeota archaeon]